MLFPFKCGFLCTNNTLLKVSGLAVAAGEVEGCDIKHVPNIKSEYLSKFINSFPYFIMHVNSKFMNQLSLVT